MSATDRTATPGHPAGRGATIAAALAGNVLEWFDFAAYAAFATIIGHHFFATGDPEAALLAAFSAFAAGFLVRPAGALLFGQIGDRLGRRRALLLSVGGMVLPSLGIGLLPGYDSIGLAAPLLLIALRICQGLAISGEYVTSMIYLAESAPPGRRARVAIWPVVGCVGGTLAGTALAALLDLLLSEAQMQDFGWRIPFGIGFLLALAGLFLRRSLPETLADRDGEEARGLAVRHALRHHWRDMLRVGGLVLTQGVFWYLLTVYAVSWLSGTVGMPAATVQILDSVVLLAMLPLLPAMGMLSDRIGRRRLFLAAAGALALLAWPAFRAMEGEVVVTVLLAQLALVAAYSAFLGSGPAVMTELFPSAVRVTAAGLSYNLVISLFGGTIPLLADWITGATGDGLAFAWLLTASAALSFLAALTLRETAFRPLPS